MNEERAVQLVDAIDAAAEHLEFIFSEEGQMLAKEAGLDMRAYSIAKTHFETGSLWLGQAVNKERLL